MLSKSEQGCAQERVGLSLMLTGLNLVKNSNHLPLHASFGDNCYSNLSAASEWWHKYQIMHLSLEITHPRLMLFNNAPELTLCISKRGWNALL